MDRQSANLNGGHRDDLGETVLRGAENQKGEALQKIAYANGGNENRKRLCFAQRFVGDALYAYAQHNAAHDACNDSYGGRKAQHGHGGDHRKSADHDDVAMREVQHFCDAINHGVAERDERVNAAKAQAADEVYD